MSRSRRMPPLFEVMRETNPPRGPLPPPTPINVPRPAAPVVRPVTPAAAPSPRRDAGGPALALAQPADDAPPPENRPAFRLRGWDLNRQVTFPAKTILLVGAAAFGVFALTFAVVWGIAWNRGHETARLKWLAEKAEPATAELAADPTATTAPDPLANPRPTQSTARTQPAPRQQQPPATAQQRQPVASVPVEAGSLAPGADPRGTGQNYLWIVTLQKLDDAEAVAAFLTRNGVPAGVVPMGQVDMATARANNHRNWEVFALEGIPSGQFRASAAKRQALEQKVESLEAALNRELRLHIRLNQHQWKKY